MEQVEMGMPAKRTASGSGLINNGGLAWLIDAFAGVAHSYGSACGGGAAAAEAQDEREPHPAPLALVRRN